MRPGKALTSHGRKSAVPILLFLTLWALPLAGATGLAPRTADAQAPRPERKETAQAAPAMARAEARIGQTVFTVDVADTPALQAKGLGGRKHLGPNDGMVFPYAEKARHSFWMRGMFIPIDIIWLDNNMVVHIEHKVPPPAPGTPISALPTYQPGSEANIVLEIAAGRAKELGLKVGDTISFRFNLR